MSAVALLALVAGSLPAVAAAQRETDDTPVALSLSGNYLAARLAGNSADIGEAARYFAEALTAAPRDPFLLERTLMLSIASGDLKAAVGYARRLQQIDEANPLSALAIGVDALRSKKYAIAVQEFEKVDSGPLIALSGQVLAAWAEAGGGDTNAALTRLDALTAESWYAFFRHYHGGLIADFGKRSDEAIRRLEEARKLDQNGVSVTEALVRAQIHAGNAQAATRALTEALLRVPGHPILVRLKEEIDGGRTPTPLAASAAEGAAEILFGLGSASARDDTGEFAMTYLQLALALNPRHDLARITLAEMFERQKQFERAIDLLVEVDPESPLKRNAEIMIGFDFNSLDKVDEARAHLSRLVEDDPSDLDAVTALGNILRVRKMFEEASEVYTRGIETIDEPTAMHWQLFYNRGITYERTDRWPQAEADFKTALELQPDQPLVLNYLGYSWVDKGMNYEEALEMIQKAVDLEPTDGYIVDSLGWAHYKLGNYEEAVRHLEEAVQLKPEDPVINDHLGDAYWKVGRRLEARFQWSHAKDRNPEPADLEKIIKKLESGLPDPARPAAADAGSPAPATTAQ